MTNVKLVRILRRKQLPEFCGLRRTQIDALIERGDFPRPIRIGQRAVGWLESEIGEWQRARIVERDADQREQT